METNVKGTLRLLEATRKHPAKLEFGQGANLPTSPSPRTKSMAPSTERPRPFRNHAQPYAPNSPYAASKAAGDHLIRASCTAFQLPPSPPTAPTTTAYQFPEKLIPLMILNALEGKELPIWVTGSTCVTGSM